VRGGRGSDLAHPKILAWCPLCPVYLLTLTNLSGSVIIRHTGLIVYGTTYDKHAQILTSGL